MRINEDEARNLLVAMGLAHAGSPETMGSVKLASCLQNLAILLDESEDVEGPLLVLQKRVFRAIENGEEIVLNTEESKEDKEDVIVNEDQDDYEEKVNDEKHHDVEELEDEDHEELNEESDQDVISHTSEPEDTEIKKGRGRPKGSKNKVDKEDMIATMKRGRGRPKGSTNKTVNKVSQNGTSKPRKESAELVEKRGPGRPRKHPVGEKREKIPVNRFGARIGTDVEKVCNAFSRKGKTELEIRNEAGISYSVEYFLDKQVRLGNLLWDAEKGYFLPPKNGK